MSRPHLGLGDEVREVLHGDKSEVLQLQGHKRRGAVEKGVQFGAAVASWQLLFFIALVIDILHFRKPP